MKIWMFLIILFGVTTLHAVTPNNSSVVYVKQIIDGSIVHTIYANLADKHIRLTPIVPSTKRDHVALFSEFLLVNHPIAFITGSLFTVKTGIPIGDIVINGKQVIWNKNPIGTALTVTKSGDVAIIDNRPNGKNPWLGYDSVLQGGVRLVKSGNVACDPLKQGFGDEFMLRPTYRIAVGITGAKKVVMVAVQSSITLDKLAVIMKKLKCIEAMALDGGASAGCAYQRKIIMSTRRRISNVLAIIAVD
jgi:exopolysaccharide biosynthesis protein